MNGSFYVSSILSNRLNANQHTKHYIKSEFFFFVKIYMIYTTLYVKARVIIYLDRVLKSGDQDTHRKKCTLFCVLCVLFRLDVA